MVEMKVGDTVEFVDRPGVEFRVASVRRNEQRVKLHFLHGFRTFASCQLVPVSDLWQVEDVKMPPWYGKEAA